MSTSVMSACWPLQMPPTQKAVLISLADNANDDGHCWPSIATICERTCFGRTAVIDAIKWLEAEGYVAANRENGRHTTYQVYPNRSGKRTGPASKPVRQTDTPVRQPDGTSPPAGRDQSASRTLTVMNRHGTVNEPSVAREAAPKASKRLPDSFVVTAELRAWARAEVPWADVDRETAAMRDHTFARAYSDWPATWRNWMRRAKGARPPPRGSPAEDKASRRSQFLAELTGRSQPPNPQPEFIDAEFRTVAARLD